MRGRSDEFGGLAAVLRPCLQVSAGQWLQGVRRMSRQQQGRWHLICARLDHTQDRIIAAQDDVSIGAAKAKRVDANQGHSSSIRQAPMLVDNAQVQLVERDIRTWALLMQCRRHGAMPQSENRLQYAGKARSRF